MVLTFGMTSYVWVNAGYCRWCYLSWSLPFALVEESGTLIHQGFYWVEAGCSPGKVQSVCDPPVPLGFSIENLVSFLGPQLSYIPPEKLDLHFIGFPLKISVSCLTQKVVTNLRLLGISTKSLFGFSLQWFFTSINRRFSAFYFTYNFCIMNYHKISILKQHPIIRLYCCRTDFWAWHDWVLCLQFYWLTLRQVGCVLMWRVD